MNKFTPIITCEHAGNQIPSRYKLLFLHANEILNTHEGWDPGAWEIATYLGAGLGIKSHGCHTTRLLIEVNRSMNNNQLFSRYSSNLSADQKQELISDIYLPYRKAVELEINQLHKPVLHLSLHSFTPEWNGKKRAVDIGLLFDPERKSEVRFCEAYLKLLNELDPSINIRFNEPYQGVDDGFTTHLRGLFDDSDYAGIEIEVNQKFITNLDVVNNLLLVGLRKLINS